MSNTDTTEGGMRREGKHHSYDSSGHDHITLEEDNTCHHALAAVYRELLLILPTSYITKPKKQQHPMSKPFESFHHCAPGLRSTQDSEILHTVP